MFWTVPAFLAGFCIGPFFWGWLSRVTGWAQWEGQG